MPRALVVPDASVLLKWALRSNDEPDRDRALALRAAWIDGACDLVVPSLWVFEVGNVLGLKEPTLAGPLLQAMCELGMPEESPRADIGSIVGLMREFKVTFYDAAYHALAIRRRAVLITADRAYATKASGRGHVALLHNWRPPA